MTEQVITTPAQQLDELLEDNRPILRILIGQHRPNSPGVPKIFSRLLFVARANETTAISLAYTKLQQSPFTELDVRPWNRRDPELGKLAHLLYGWELANSQPFDRRAVARTSQGEEIRLTDPQVLQLLLMAFGGLNQYFNYHQEIAGTITHGTGALLHSLHGTIEEQLNAWRRVGLLMS